MWQAFIMVIVVNIMEDQKFLELQRLVVTLASLLSTPVRHGLICPCQSRDLRRQSRHYLPKTRRTVNTRLDRSMVKSINPQEQYPEIPLTPPYSQTSYDIPADLLVFSAVAATGDLVQKGPSSDA